MLKTSIALTGFLLIGSNILYAQEVRNLDHCDCKDKIEKLTPEPDGKFERIFKDKIVETGSFKNGKKDGEWITYSPKGTVIRKINYTNGLLNGSSEIFYGDGKKKLSASFNEGKQNGKWTYFTANGKIFIEGNYNNGKPLDIWTIYDKKGKSPSVQYDFTNGSYLLNNPVVLHKDNKIFKSDNTGEYYILRYPERREVNGTAPLGGFMLSSDLLVDLVEIPVDYWDSYISYDYFIRYNVSGENISSFQIDRKPNLNNYGFPIYPFLVSTDPESQLIKKEHTELSKKLLDSKINEAVSFLPPWIFKDKSDIEVYLPYVVNRIIRF